MVVCKNFDIFRYQKYHFGYRSQGYNSCQSQIIEPEPRAPLKKTNPYKIQVVITSLIEMPGLPNFGHMTAFAIEFQSRDKILLMTL